MISLWFISGSCTFKNIAKNEPRELKTTEIKGIVQNEKKLNATYSYLLYLYHNNSGDSELARKALALSLKSDPDSTELKLQEAQDLFTRGLYASARESLLSIRKQNSEAEKLYIQLLVREGNLSEARVALDKWLAAYPKDEDFYSLRARIEIEEQNLAAADKVLLGFIRELPESSQVYLLRGRVHQIRDKNKEAVSDYRRALELDPQNVTAAAHLAFLQDMIGQKEDAMKTYVWLADATDNPEFHKRLGLIYLEKSDPRRAIAALEAYARHQPQDMQNRARLAALYLEIKEYEQAEYKLKGLIEEQPTNDLIRYYYSAALSELEKKELALKELVKIKREATVFPEKIKLELEIMGQLGQEKNAKTLALNLANETMAKAAHEDQSLFGVLYVYLSQKKLKTQSRQLLERGLELFPKNNLLRYNLALLLDEEGKWQEALKIAQLLLKEDSENPAIKNLVGYIMANQGVELKKAESLIEAALKMRPDDPYILDSKAWVKFKLNKHSEALSILENIVKLKPEESVFKIHLADVLAKVGRIQEALALYEKALGDGVDAARDRLRAQEQIAKLQDFTNRKISGTSNTNSLPSK